MPPERQELDAIPELASLAAAPEDHLVLFAVEGDELVGKHVRDAAVAEGALGLWQELVLRVPTNQRLQLVQFALFEDPDLAGFVDNTGTANLVGRYGTSLAVSADYASENEPDPCAPLSGHRGTYDWTLIHEFGHLRQYADGVVDAFVAAFPPNVGDGEGYPEDGTPTLDGDFVTSYAESGGADEDAAESWTTYVMLPELPDEQSLAADKVRMFAEQPGYPELRLALRVTEPDGGGVDVPEAPTRTFDLDVRNPSWLVGTWVGDTASGAVSYEIGLDDLVYRLDGPDGLVTLDYAHLRDDGTLATVTVVESSEAFHLLQVAVAGDSWSESFSLEDDGSVRVDREGLGEFTVLRVE